MTPPWIEGIVAAGAVVAALFVIFRGVLSISKTVGHIQQAIGEDSEGLTLAERHEQTEKHLQSMDTRVKKVEEILSPPGEVPLPKRVDQVEADVADVRKQVEHIDRSIADLTDVVNSKWKGIDE